MAIKISNSTIIDDSRNIVDVGIITATSARVGSAVTMNSSGINVAGIVTATSFVGDGSGLTGAGSTVADDTSTNATFYPLFTQTTSGTVTATKVSTTKLTFNPSTGLVVAGIVSATGIGTLGTNGTGARTIQSGGTASGGSSGDIYYIY
jgi:hypothetical protein